MCIEIRLARSRITKKIVFQCEKQPSFFNSDFKLTAQAGK